MATPVRSNLDFENTAKVINLPNPTAAQDAATKAYVDSGIEGLAWKDSVRVATSSNINLASPGATLDGITMVTGDRFLARGQTTTSQNGIYIWNGAAVAATRALDANTAAELEQAVTTVEEGTDAGTTWRQTAVNFVLDTDPVTWTSLGTSVADASETVRGKVEIATQAETDAGTLDAPYVITPLKLKTSPFAAKRYAVTFGDGAATQYDLTHNLGTKDIVVSVRRVSDDVQVLCDVTMLSTTVVRLNFASAPASNSLRAVAIA